MHTLYLLVQKNEKSGCSKALFLICINGLRYEVHV